MSKLYRITLLILFLAGKAIAGESSELFLGSGEPAELREALEAVVPGTVLILGEQHNNEAHQRQHMAVLTGLRDRGLKVSVGMEFVAYPFQSSCDRWLKGEITTEVFLQEIAWGTGNPFRFYQEQMAFPRPSFEEKLIALNAPRSLTRKISREGLAQLTDAEKALMPPHFALGNAEYFERFVAAMGGHVPDPEAVRRYFAAQSTWDDTMAWKAQEFLVQNPEQVLVIIVGEFHVQYQGGLPDRLRARGVSKLLTFSQVNTKDMSEEERRNQILPDPKYGPRADYVWTSNF
jgi:uncharacterized iron-regulated protein